MLELWSESRAPAICIIMGDGGGATTGPKTLSLPASFSTSLDGRVRVVISLCIQLENILMVVQSSNRLVKRTVCVEKKLLPRSVARGWDSERTLALHSEDCMQAASAACSFKPLTSILIDSGA